MMDNRIFNVNGTGEKMLLSALELVFMQRGEKTTCSAWQATEKGLILLWYKCEGSTPLPSSKGMTAVEVLPMVLGWLSDVDIRDIEMGRWDVDQDGHNSIGWRVYCEDWGKVGGNSSAICAVKPAFMWYGK